MLHNAIQPKIAAFFSIPLRAELYQALRDYAATADAEALDPVRRRLLDRTLVYFKRQGGNSARRTRRSSRRRTSPSPKRPTVSHKT